MMYFFLLKKKTTTAKNLFGNNKLVDFSKNLKQKKQNRSKTSLTLLKKITPMPTRMKKKTEVETKEQQ